MITKYGKLNIIIGENQESREIDIENNGSGDISIKYSPSSAGEKLVSIALLDIDENYQDGWMGHINVKKEMELKESVAKGIEDFFVWLIGLITSLIGL